MSRSPDRFIGLGIVSLQDVYAAIDELVFLCDELGLAGVALGNPTLEPFLAAASALGASVFVHPTPCDQPARSAW